MEIAHSVNSVPIRLTSERWVHIVENHDELVGKLFDVLETVADPDYVLRGKNKEFLAVRKISPHSLVVAYREISHTDGFVITAFQTTKVYQLLRARKTIWRKSHQ